MNQMQSVRDQGARRFEAEYRVRFDEAGADGVLRDSGYLRYMQDLAWRHSEAMGFDRAWYAARRLQWLVRCVELEVAGATRFGDTLTVSTQVVGWRRVWARRRSEARLKPAANPLAVALIDWVLLDERGRPSRVPDGIAQLFTEDLTAFEPARVGLPDPPSDASDVHFTVSSLDLDPLAHVNNARYVDYVAEAWAVDRLPRRYRVEFVRPAGPDARLALTTWSDGDVRCARLTDASGTELLRAVGS
jgi:acyl-CoA thioesterase FadM